MNSEISKGGGRRKRKAGLPTVLLVVFFLTVFFIHGCLVIMAFFAIGGNKNSEGLPYIKYHLTCKFSHF